MKNLTLRTFIFALSMMLVTVGAFAQARQISGVVKDASGPVSGATVVIKGTTKGAQTDSKGAFSLEVTPGAVVQVTAMGYSPREITIANQARLDVTMLESAEQLEELVVIGYGTQKKTDLTNAVATVDTKDMLATPSTNLAEMLRGRVSGVQVTSTSGRPGSASTIKIRGIRSMIDGNSAPLFVVDGATVDAAEFANINPNDIESVSVLKDAASQAIYGARAANGVILAQTKRGKNANGTITFESKVGIQSLWRNFDFYSPQEWYDMRAEATANYLGRNASELTVEQVLGSSIMEDAYNDNTPINWEKAMLKNAINQEYSLTFRGGTERLKTAISLGYFNQDGMLRLGSGYKRGNVRVNVDYQLKKWLTVGTSIAYSKSGRDHEDGQFEKYIGAPPFAQIYDKDGKMLDYMNSEDQNPVYLQNHSKGLEVNEVGRYTGYVEIKPFKGLTYRLNGSYYSRYREEGTYTDRYYTSVGSMATIDIGKYQRDLIDNIITYNVPFSCPQHSLTLTGVASYDKNKYTTLQESTRNISVDRDWNMISDGEFADDDRIYKEDLAIAFIGRVNYTLMERYLFSASICRNGSSKFGQNNKWASFYSASAGWKINEESFLKNVSWIDNLKLRFSYGEVGNEGAIPPYTTVPLATAYSTEFGNYPVMGYSPGSMLPNPFLKWETTRSYNAGVDFGFFKNRLTGTVEYYQTKTDDLLVNKKINSNLGYTYMYENLGQTKSTGYEVSVAYDVVRNNKFHWNLSANVTGFKNEIVRVDDNKNPDGSPMADEANRWFPGHPINVYYEYKFDGIYQTSDFVKMGGNWLLMDDIDTNGDGYGDRHVIPYQTNCAPGMIKVKDRDGNLEINSDDKYIRSIDPDFMASLTSNMSYKGFDLMADFYCMMGGIKRNPLLYETANGTLRGRYNGIKVHYWTEENPSNRFPRPHSLQNPALNGSCAIQSTDYIRLRTLALGYTFPSSITEKLKISNLRLSVTATNLWTATEYLSYSPEFSANGYPEPRQLLFGLNMTF